jgi:hypothetical protein
VASLDAARVVPVEHAHAGVVGVQQPVGQGAALEKFHHGGKHVAGGRHPVAQG